MTERRAVMHLRRLATMSILAVLLACKKTGENKAPPIVTMDAASGPVVATMDAAAPAPKAPHTQKRGPANVCVALKDTREEMWFERPARALATTEPCKTLAAKHSALVGRATAPRGDAGDATGIDKVALDAFRCVPSKDGAWATTFDTLASAAAKGLTGRLAIARYDADGKRIATAVPGLVEELRPSSYGSLTTKKDNFEAEAFSEMTWVSSLTVFDWDGDGQPEVFLRMSKKFHEGGSWYRGWIWTVKAGELAEYSPAHELYPAAVFDADGDGRPDVFSTAPFAEEYTSQGMGSSHLAEGPLLMAHSLDDGTFAVDDDVAKDAARCACPLRPDPFVLPPELDFALTPVACARIWGLQTATINAAINKTCDGKKDGDVDLSSCLYRGVLEQLAGKAPTVHLP